MTQNQEMLEAYIRDAKNAEESHKAALAQIELLKVEVEKEEVAKFEKSTPEGMLKEAIRLIRNLLSEGVEFDSDETFYISVEDEEVEITKDIRICREAEDVIDEFDAMLNLVEAYDELDEEVEAE